MATAGAKQMDCKLIHVGTLELEQESPFHNAANENIGDDLKRCGHNDYSRNTFYTRSETLVKADIGTWYSGLVVFADLMMVVDYNARKLLLHNRHNGKLLTTYDKLHSLPFDVCLVGGTQVGVTLVNGQIEILSIVLTGQSAVIRCVRTLDVTRGFYKCYGVKALRSGDTLVVSGIKWDKETPEDCICWGLVSLVDEEVCTIHKICKGYEWCYVATSTDDSTVYISCRADYDSPNNGVYAFVVMDGSKKFVYRHSDLNKPEAVSVDKRGFIYVCNRSNPPCIHQLTESGEPVTIHREVMPLRPLAVYWGDQQEELYFTSYGRKEVWRFRPMWSDQQVIPAEVLKMDAVSLQIYKDALQDGKEKVYSVRVMVVGQYGVGKTTLTKRLLGEDVKISESECTEGIDVHMECCKVSLRTGQWTTQEKNADHYSRLQRLVKILNERVQKQDTSGKQEGQSEMADLVDIVENDIDRKVTTTPLQPLANVDQMPVVDHGGAEPINVSMEVESSTMEKQNDTVMEILQLLNKNADKLETSIVEYARLALWDFAGQYVFYTTHQTFLTSRAIYLLVIDLSQQVKDLIKDDMCFLDTEGIKSCAVHDLVEIWLNSIHSCAPSSNAGIPPVILVGTHVDTIPENLRQKVIDEYFLKIRLMLRDKPIILHLMDDIAIDNTQCDPKLEELKRRIFELASQQPHWGEEKPARWLPLEQAMMTLKASGIKVAPLTLIEEINRSGSIRIEDRRELDLFLRFQHEMGTILYFSVDGLREKIVLDPQWLIDAQKTLITGDVMFIRRNPAITSKWYEFKNEGKLTHALIDALWTKEKHPDLHDNKEHILLLMEQLNIIAKPRSYLKDGASEIKEANYFLAPCMLHQKTPREVMCPVPGPQMESSSVLCHVFTSKFLPSPIFHRLLAACVAKWPIATKKTEETVENLIFCGCGVFQLDQFHKLILHFRDYVIFMRVTRQGIRDKTPSLKLCIEVRKFVTAMLCKVIGYLDQSLQFDQFIQCSEYTGDSVNALIPVSLLKENAEVRCDFHDNIIESYKLLKFWFEDQDSQGQYEIDTASFLSPNLQDEKLSERQLGRLSMKIGHESFHLGLELGLSMADIQQIQKDYPHTVEQSFRILIKWKQRSGDRATLRNLEKAFILVGIDVDILRSTETAGDRVYCLPEEMLDKQPEDRDLNRICNSIVTERVHLGVELGVPLSKLDKIITEHPYDVSRQSFEIMREWTHKQAGLATFRNLEQAFNCVGIDPDILKCCAR